MEYKTVTGKKLSIVDKNLTEVNQELNTVLNNDTQKKLMLRVKKSTEKIF